MKIHDENNIPKLLEVLEELGDIELEIGVLGQGKGGSRHKGSDATIVDIANFHEYGTSRIPERSFMRASFDKNQGEYMKQGESLIRQAFNFEIEASGVERAMGEAIVGKTQEFLTKLSHPPLADATIKARKKGSSNPLVDTGQLRDSIEWKKV